ALAAASVLVELSADIRRVLWEKYLFICAQAGLTALTRCPIGIVRGIPETWRMFRTILEEVTALARASGVTLAANVVETLVKQGEALPPTLMASLGNDLIQGRRLELGAPPGAGAAAGLPPPPRRATRDRDTCGVRRVRGPQAARGRTPTTGLPRLAWPGPGSRRPPARLAGTSRGIAPVIRSASRASSP